jgi:hypothetical protein
MWMFKCFGARFDALVGMFWAAGSERKKTMRLMIVCALTMFAGAQTAQATVVMKLNRAQMTDMSQLVVQVRVGTIRTVEERPGALSTLIELEVIEAFKGKVQTGSALTLLQMGGELGDLIQSVPGTSKFKTGEELVLFLSAFQNRFVQVGVGLGRYVVERNAQGAFAVEEFGNVAFAEPGKDGVIRPGEAPEPAHMPLPQLAAEVRRFAGAQR